MGGGTSSGRMSAFIQTLKQENCTLSHPIWLEISINDMPNQYLSEEDVHNLIIIKNKQPDNFSSLVRVTIDVFSQASKISDFENSQNTKYINVCDFICFLLSISNDLDDNISSNCWFKPPQLNISAMKPIMNLMDTLQRLLRFNDPIQLFLQSSILDLRLSYTKTLLFLIHAKSLGGNQCESDPSQFLLTFDSFCWNRFLHELFELIPIVLSNNNKNLNSEKELLLVRALITTAIPCLYSCFNWNIQQFNVNLIHSSLSIIKQYNNEKVISLSEQLVTLLFIIISQHQSFLDYLFSSNQIIEYITSLLYFYQIRFYANLRSSFFHKLILIILSKFTSNEISLNEPFNGHFTIQTSQTTEIHRGTYSDLIIEVITNPLVEDSKSIESLTSLVLDVILNLSTTSTNLSFFSGNRLFIVLKKLLLCESYQKVDFENSIQKLLCSLFQLIKFQPKSNINLLTIAVENEMVLNHIVSIYNPLFDKKNCEQKSDNLCQKYALSILKIANHVRPSLMITNNQDKIKEYNNLIDQIASEFDKNKIQPNIVSIESFNEIKPIWFDWFRLLFLITFPKDAKKAALTFASIEKVRKPNSNTAQKQARKRKKSLQLIQQQKNTKKMHEKINQNKESQNGQVTTSEIEKYFKNEDKKCQENQIQQQETHQTLINENQNFETNEDEHQNQETTKNLIQTLESNKNQIQQENHHIELKDEQQSFESKENQIQQETHQTLNNENQNLETKDDEHQNQETTKVENQNLESQENHHNELKDKQQTIESKENQIQQETHQTLNNENQTLESNEEDEHQNQETTKNLIQIIESKEKQIQQQETPQLQNNENQNLETKEEDEHQNQETTKVENQNLESQENHHNELKDEQQSFESKENQIQKEISQLLYNESQTLESNEEEEHQNHETTQNEQQTIKFQENQIQQEIPQTLNNENQTLESNEEDEHQNHETLKSENQTPKNKEDEIQSHEELKNENQNQGMKENESEIMKIQKNENESEILEIQENECENQEMKENESEIIKIQKNENENEIMKMKENESETQIDSLKSLKYEQQILKNQEGLKFECKSSENENCTQLSEVIFTETQDTENPPQKINSNENQIKHETLETLKDERQSQDENQFQQTQSTEHHIIQFNNGSSQKVSDQHSHRIQDKNEELDSQIINKDDNLTTLIQQENNEDQKDKDQLSLEIHQINESQIQQSLHAQDVEEQNQS